MADLPSAMSLQTLPTTGTTNLPSGPSATTEENSDAKDVQVQPAQAEKTASLGLHACSSAGLSKASLEACDSNRSPAAAENGMSSEPLMPDFSKQLEVRQPYQAMSTSISMRSSESACVTEQHLSAQLNSCPRAENASTGLKPCLGEGSRLEVMTSNAAERTSELVTSESSPLTQKCQTQVSQLHSAEERTHDCKAGSDSKAASSPTAFTPPNPNSVQEEKTATYDELEPMPPSDNRVTPPQPSTPHRHFGTSVRHASASLTLSTNFKDWMRQAASRWAKDPPRSSDDASGGPRSWQEQFDAAMLDVLGGFASKARLDSYIVQRLKRLPWGPPLLRTWEELFLQEHKGDGNVPSKLQVLQGMRERWPLKRPCQRNAELKDPNKSKGFKVEHDDAMVLKTIRYQYLKGALDERLHDALFLLPQVWALDMLLSWEAQLMEKLRRIAAAFPERMPRIGDGTPAARWLREFRVRARCGDGLSRRLDVGLRAALPWMAHTLQQWSTRAERENLPQPRSHRRSVADRLRSLVKLYPGSQRPPARRLYVCSEEERQEQADAVFLDRVGKLHFDGIVRSDEIVELAKMAEWLQELLVEWERNRAENIDPEERFEIARLREIGQRHSLPPTQAAALEKKRWSFPHEVRVRHSDAWFLRLMKDKYFNQRLSEPVLEAMRAIPVWGAARLEEWRVQKDARSMMCFQRMRRKWKKPKGSYPSDAKRSVGCIVLHDDDRLFRTGKEPRSHQKRVRVDCCHGKTVAEALASVRSGVLRLTRKVIAHDMSSGHLRVERSSGEGVEGPTTPSRGSCKRRWVLSSRKRTREESFRSLTGQVVTVQNAGTRPAKAKEMPPMAEVSVGDIDNMTAEELTHFERHMRWNTKRAHTERLEKLSREIEANSQLPWANSCAATGAAPGADETQSPQLFADNTVGPKRPVSFTDLTEYQRLRLSAEEMRYFEQQHLITDGEELTLQERRDRLKDHVRQSSFECASKREQVFMKQWQVAASTRERVTTIEDDEDGENSAA